MKRFIIFGVGMLIGGGIGAGISYYFTKKKVEDQCQQDINEIKKSYSKKSQGEKTENKSENEKQDKEEEADPAEEEARKKHLNKVPDKPVPEKYKNLTRTYAADDGNDRSDIDPSEEEFPDDDEPDVCIISVDEFDKIDHSFEHTTVMYYTGDECLAYEDGELIDNEKYLFEDSLNMDDAWDGNHLYVKNNRIGEMFDIQKIDGNYGDLN